MKINKIEILINTQGTDMITFHTDLPGMIFPFDESQKLKSDVTKGKGIEFVKENFNGIECIVIDMKTGMKTNIKDI